MEIAVLGFGSLVNQPYSEVYNTNLEIKRPENAMPSNNFNISADSSFTIAEGLKLPIRLGRLSSAGTDDRRITLVLYSKASNEQMFFAESKFSNLDQAIKNLREREGTTAANIGYVNLLNDTSRSHINDVAVRIANWARNKGYDAVIWTDLPSNLNFNHPSTGREIMPLLQADPTLLENTKKYIQSLPSSNSLQRDILALESAAYQASLTADFAERDSMDQTNVPRNKWFHPDYGTWGPLAKTFPAPEIPTGVDPIRWKRDRIVAVAEKYKRLPYKRADGQRGHFPDRGCGLDCSNYASWVYNYGLGIKFTSDIDALITKNNKPSGRFIRPDAEPLQKGDLLFYRGNVNHAVIYMGDNKIIDSTSARTSGVAVSDLNDPRYQHRLPNSSNPIYIGARRPIE